MLGEIVGVIDTAGRTFMPLLFARLMSPEAAANAAPAVASILTRLRREANAADDQRKADARRAAEAERAARRASAMWSRLTENGESEYLARKGIAGFGVRYAPSGALVLPLLDVVLEQARLARVLAADSRVVQALQLGRDPGLRDYVQGICSRTDAAYMVVTDEHARDVGDRAGDETSGAGLGRGAEPFARAKRGADGSAYGDGGWRHDWPGSVRPRGCRRRPRSVISWVSSPRSPIGARHAS